MTQHLAYGSIQQPLLANNDGRQPEHGHGGMHEGNFLAPADEMVKSSVTAVDSTSKSRLFAELLAEFIGTFFLCSCVGFAGSSPEGPLAIGWMLAVMIYACGHLSGSHFNPAVTLCAALCTKVDWSAVPLYMVSQIGGAILAGVLADSALSPPVAFPQTGEGFSDGQALLGEFLVTTALCFTVCSVAFSKKQAGNSFFGLAIGFVVTAGAASVGPVSGGAFNPAVGCLPLLHGGTVWIYWLGPSLGAVAAALLYRLVHSDEFAGTSAAAHGFFTKAAPFVMEVIGTFYLCFVVGMRGTQAYEVGAILTSMVFAGGCVSGGHYNPAVTLAVLLSRAPDTTAKKSAAYWVCQLTGSALAAAAATTLSAPGSTMPSANFPALCTDATCARPPSPATAIALEAVATFALAWTVLNVAVSRCTSGNSFFGFAIGFQVFALAAMFGGVTGGAFNPAVGMLGFFQGHGDHAYIYWLGPLAGAALAALAFTVTREDKDSE